MKTLHIILKKTLFAISVWSLAIPYSAAQIPSGYSGKPYRDSFHKIGAQVIPGVVQLAYYDQGGEGVGYHDTDAVNHGSGKLNYDQKCPESGRKKPNGHNCHFREHDGVDVSYTKDMADFNHPNLLTPPAGQLYIGWQADGEWLNYTVNVKHAGQYRVTALYGNNDNQSSLWINHKKSADLTLPFNTGSMHAWNKAVVGTIEFKKAGLNLLTLRYNAGANLAYLEFERVRHE